MLVVIAAVASVVVAAAAVVASVVASVFFKTRYVYVLTYLYLPLEEVGFEEIDPANTSVGDDVPLSSTRRGRGAAGYVRGAAASVRTCAW